MQFSRLLNVKSYLACLYPPDGDGEVHGGDEGAAAHGDAEEEDGLEDVPVVPLQQALGPANQYSTVQYSTVQYRTVLQYSANAPPLSDSGFCQPDLSPM